MRKCCPLLFFAILLSLPVLFGQSNIASGELKGTVTDQSGAVVPAVSITVTNTSNNFHRVVVTDEHGEYRVLALTPGTYEVRAELTGFVTQQRAGVQVSIGEIASADFKLQVGSSTETITVTGEAAVIETERVQQSETINENYIKHLPIDRRDYLTFTLLAPGVVDSNAMADNTDFRAAQTPQSGLSFYGSNGRGNNVTVDGAEANDSAGGVRETLSQEAVQEFQINRSNYSAELGGASGGVINIVSKSGGNATHGSVFGFFRDQHLDAADPFAYSLVSDKPQRIKPPANRQQFGGRISLPIVKDRTFLFGAYEGLQRNESSTVSVLTDLSIFQPTAQQNSVLNALAGSTSTSPITCMPSVPGAASLPPAVCASVLRSALTSKASTVDLFKANSGVFPFTTGSNSFSIRLDHKATDSNQVFLRYNFSKKNEGNQSTRALLGFSRSNDVEIFDSNAVLGWTGIASASLVNEARFQWDYRHFDVIPNDPNGPELNITGYGFFNRDIFLPNYSIERRYEASDSLSYMKGDHRFKFGGSVLTRATPTSASTFLGGRFGFGTLPGALVSPALGALPITALQAFDLGLPQSYQQGFGDPMVTATLTYFSVYAQDTWNVDRHLTLNLGVRYEMDDRRDPIPTDKNNFAPRIGFAWDPVGDKRTVVRGGFGIFYSPIYFQIDHVVNSLGEVEGFRQIAQVLTTLSAANPLAASGPINIYRTLRAQGVVGVPQTRRTIVPSDLTQFGINVSHTGPRPPLTVLFQIDPNYRSAYSEQASLGIEREIAKGLSASINYTYVRTLKITRARDTNILARPIGALGIPDWNASSGCTGAGLYKCFRDPLLYQENQYESSANAFYHGMIIEMARRFGNNFSVAGNYTFSKAIDEVTDFNTDFQPNDQTNLREERALSAFDQRHKIVLYAYMQTPSASGSSSSLAKVFGDFGLTPIFRANSARPFNLLVGGELNGDRHSTTDRPVFAGRNTGIGPGFWTFDLRLSKQIRLGGEHRLVELTAEGFNLLNHLNFSSVNNTVGPNFQGPFRVEANPGLSASSPLGFTSAFDARRFQLGVRFSF
jgi:hypothetical protein